MVSVAIRVSGLTAVQAMIRQISGSGKEWGRTKIRGGTPLPYGYGIETGKQKSGRIARKAGGAFMFKLGIAQIKPLVRTALLAAIPLGPAAIQAASQGIAVKLRSAVQEGTPVVSGNLRNSIFTRVE